jgi:hypothetical protein
VPAPYLLDFSWVMSIHLAFHRIRTRMTHG